MKLDPKSIIKAFNLGNQKNNNKLKASGRKEIITEKLGQL